MKTATVEKERLRATLEKNRAEHRAKYEKAAAAFRAKYIETVESYLDRAKNGGQVELYVNLTEPVDQTEDYDRAIEMLDWETGDEIELTENEFRQYVQDKWAWTGQFTATNTAYGVT